MTEEQAQMIAIRALQHISADEALLQRFLTLSGLDVSDIRQVAANPEFLHDVLAFLRQDESECSMFASNLGLSAQDLNSAARALSPMPFDEKAP